jgi:rubrerythrin
MGLLDRTRSDEQRSTYARGQPYISGETVTPGSFRCAECGYEHEVPEGRITNLPVCPACQAERWERG